MKVSELEIGMIVKPIHADDRFLPSPQDEWIQVVKKYYTSSRVWGLKRRVNRAVSKDQKVAVYLGRKKDIGNTNIQWSDRFVLFDNKVLAVDPPAWRRLQPAYE
jgi:hypothetical protein